MPISIQLTEGLLKPEGLRTVFPRVASALLRAHGVEGNTFMEASVLGHVQLYPQQHCHVGGRCASLALVEVKVPPVTFLEQAVRDQFISELTDIIDALQAGDHPRGRTYVNVSYAVDGTWGIGERAYTNAALGEAIAAGFR